MNAAKKTEATFLAPPIELHGLQVIASFRRRPSTGVKPGCVILVEKDNEYVTGTHCDGDSGWTSGHYFSKVLDLQTGHDFGFNEAMADFFERCKHNC